MMEAGGIDARNASFWDELCGSALARQVGVEDASAESLERFDAAYMGNYPYLESYVPADLGGAELLEIGLGYGTLSALLIARGARYHGADIAEGPVEMVRHRLRLAGQGQEADRAGDPGLGARPAVRDRALRLRLHDRLPAPHRQYAPRRHRGAPRAATRRNRGRDALPRPLAAPAAQGALPALLRRRRTLDEQAAMYDTNAAGEAAPHVDYWTRGEVRGMFGAFSSVDIDVRNFDNTRVVPRERLLGNIDRVLGLDLYITARK